MIRTRAIAVHPCAIPSIVAALTEQLEEDHEKIYEIEIERQRAEHGLLAGDISAVVLQIHLLDALSIVGGKADEYDDPDDGDGELKGARPDEDIDEGRDHDTDEAHHEERAEARKIGLGRIAIEAHDAVGRRRDEEHVRNRFTGEHQEDASERETHDGGIEPEQHRRSFYAHALDAKTERQHETERRQHDEPDQRRGRNGLIETRS